MKNIVILSIVFAAVFVLTAAQTSCSDVFDGWSTDCLNADSAKPFCILEKEGDITSNRRCTECRPGNICDCPLDYYCANAPGSVSNRKLLKKDQLATINVISI